MTEKPDLENAEAPRERSAKQSSRSVLPVFAPGGGGGRPIPKNSEPCPEPESGFTPAELDLTRNPQTNVDLTLLDGTMLRLESEVDQPPAVSIQQSIRRHRHPLSSMLVSTIVHTALLLALILIVFQFPEPAPRIGILAEIDARPLPPREVDVEAQTVEIDIPEETQSPIDMEFDEISKEPEMEVAESSESVLNSLAEQNDPTVSEVEAPIRPQQTLPTGGGLEGRESNARARLAASRGGSRASELAVEQALKWIVAHQQEDGSWRFRHHAGPCDGRCDNQGTRESTTAATGLALMSLLGAGYTHEAGPYQQSVAKGLDYLVEKIRFTKHGGILAEGEAGMYSHAIATIALAEALTMTGDTNLIGSVEGARKYIVTAQHSKGGWRYNPGYPGDMTVTGWQIMALKSCELAGFPTERAIWQKAEQFIDSLGSSSGRYGYQSADEKNPTTTSIGLLSKMYLGMAKEHGYLELGASYVFDQGPSPTDVYFNYYATQVMHHLQGPNWKTWNREMRDYLINTQVRVAGHEAGSWFFQDKHGQVGGRLYTTAMAVMTLEVYYRFMPLYEEQAVEAEKIRQDQILR